MHRILKLASLFISIFCLPAFTLAQSFDQSPEGLKNFIINLYEIQVNQLQKEKNVSSIQDKIDPIFNGYEVNVDLDGNVEYRKLNRTFILNRVESYAMYERLQVEYKVDDIYRTRISGKSGIIEFRLTYNLKEKQRIVSEGSTLINIIAKYTTTGWKITYLSDFGMDDLKTKGDCFCEIYSKGKEKYYATILYPNGDQYSEQMYSIKTSIPFDLSILPVPLPVDILLQDKEPLKKFVFNKKEEFLWYNQSRSIYKGEEIIGGAKNPNRVIREILLFMHQDNCNSIRLKKMR